MPLPHQQDTDPASKKAKKEAKGGKGKGKGKGSAHSNAAHQNAWANDFYAVVPAPAPNKGSKATGGSAPAPATATATATALVEVALEEITEVWAPLSPKTLTKLGADPPAGSAAEERVMAAQAELVSRWYLRSPADLQRGIESAVMAVQGGGGYSSGDDDADGAYSSGDEGSGEEEWGCEQCGLKFPHDQYDAAVAHEKSCEE
jgi:hypothetical protein